jgi:YbbR domain-containing protein
MITRFFKKIYRFFDKILITPISRAIYYLNKRLKKGQGFLDKLLNRPMFLIYLSLALAIVFFLLIDHKVITLVEKEAEVITNVPVIVKYNDEAYVVEGVPSTVDITISGRKSDIYLAKQLGNYEVILDLTDYTPRTNPYKAYFTWSKSISSLTYKLDPSYVQVTIKNKESQVKTIDYDLLNIDALDSKLSVKSVTLNKTEVVVKGSNDALSEIATVKALIDLERESFTESGTYDIDDVELVAYDSKGNKLSNIEIVPSTISATVVLESFSKDVSISVNTIGSLVPGKALASLSINGNPSYSITIYGDKSEIEDISSVPVTIDVDGLGNDSTKTYSLKITKPAGVRSMSTDNVNITVTFGEEKQKTISIGKNIQPRNLADGLTANALSNQDITVQVKGVQSVIDKITEEDIKPYVDLTNLTAQDDPYEVEVKIDNNNPLVSYVVSSKLKVKITK